MATKKKETVNLIDSFAEFKETKNIDRATLVSVLEECFRSVIAKTYGSDENYDVIVNPDKGDFEIYRNRTVVPDGEVTDPNMQIALSEARQVEDDYEIGEEVSQQVDFADFGRRAILTLRQTLASRILELEHDTLYNSYKDRIGEIVSAEVYQNWKRETLLLDDEGNELLLPRTEQIPGDFFRKGENARAVISRVENTNGTPRIILSRTDPAFMQRMMEAEVPEIQDGLITIHKIARIPGERAKIAVESYDERIDPVGACVGVKGSRVHGIVRELRGENIDVITWTSNTQLMITRALGPARVNSVVLNEEAHTAEVYLDPDQVSLAIGKGGLNIKLASMLTGYTIDVFREVENVDEDDVSLDEFTDDIEPWIIDEFKKIGLNTARDVLAEPRESLMQRADLEEETVDEVLKILSAEFED
ncbi:MAG: transcription termination/antitermination protein NusA [Bacteroidaceae bacterium]|nr:transcription termination/antitermination protein NusA [Bacteroidaceae bacterium]MBQ2459912.1 transcription termination/antitermination protein NusA [Bacteroidaceae bacterium]MBQ2595191.1 transcription termination/antitermination protein NusA [Bacteroidaceae bacterium]MBQ3957787.1 transcription termination/antitermination protein NusA [Bacteroidaceae bacterium]MBQ3993066.1 transcription termination/antitermination protein NusA [Bacteroidaceae bacterium]